MKQIPLSQGKFALVDDEDYDWLMQWKWFFSARYAKRTINKSKKHNIEKTSNFFMHRAIIVPPLDLFADHIDGNGLNNQRSNLRIVTKSQNRGNSKRALSNESSKYKGVFFAKDRNKWRAKIGRTHLGAFETEVDAASAYDDAAREYWGRYAKLNFPSHLPLE